MRKKRYRVVRPNGDSEFMFLLGMEVTNLLNEGCSVTEEPESDSGFQLNDLLGDDPFDFGGNFDDL